MSANSSQLTKKEKENGIRRRKSVTSGAGVKQHLNCLSTLSTLHSHSSSSALKRNKSLSLTMCKSSAKKKQERYVQVHLGKQQFMQQFSRTGGSVVVKEGGQDQELQNLTLQQKIKVFFILLMIPSAMVVFFSNNKFRSDSGHSTDPNMHLNHLGAMGGMGGIPGGYGPGVPPGFGGRVPGAYDRGSDRRPMRRHYDPEYMDEHLDHLDPRLRNREQNYRQKSRENVKQKIFKRSDDHYNQNGGIPVPHMDSRGLNEPKLSQNQLNSELNPNVSEVKVDKRENVPKNEEIQQKEPISGQNRNESKLTETELKKVSDNGTTLMKTDNPGAVEGHIEPGYKIIVLWTPMTDFAFIGSQAFIDAKCVINKCFFTTNKSYSNQSDAIVVNARYVATHKLPNMRSSHQKWIFYSNDSPQYVGEQDWNYLSNVFNWSWTYRSDSDIVYSIGNVEQMNSEYKDSDVFDVWRRKTKMIFWFANSCQTKSQREAYVYQLKAYIDIDMYGNCSTNANDINIGNETDLKTLSETYLFVIVFEKSFCKDFVTKRLFQFLEHNMIPIVMGGADYSRIVPPNSVINANEFSSAKELADYVLDIGTDFEKYKKYFEWKRNNRIDYERKDFCQLCYKLHEEVNRFKTYVDVKKWWLDEANCQQWNLSMSPHSQ